VRVHDWLGGVWQGYQGGPEIDVPEVDTTVKVEVLADLMTRASTVPDDFNPHKKIQRLLAQRREMAAGARPFDWCAAASLAFAYLVPRNVRVRMTGQYCGRSTFSQRHAVLHDVVNRRPYMPLVHLDPNPAPIEIYNSPLSEAGVMGF